MASNGLELPLIAQVPRPFSLTMRPPASTHVPTAADAILVGGGESLLKTAPRPSAQSAPVPVLVARAAEKAKVGGDSDGDGDGAERGGGG